MPLIWNSRSGEVEKLVPPHTQDYVAGGNVGPKDDPVGRRAENIGVIIVDDVLAVAALENIGVAAKAAREKVIPEAAIHDVRSARAEDGVIPVGAGNDQACDEGFVPNRAVVELNFLDQGKV